MAIKNPIYQFLLLQISSGIVFTLKIRNFQFNGVQVPIHIFISAHAMKIHIAPSPVRSKPDSLTSRCTIIVICTCICVFVNKLFKIRSDILYGHTDSIYSAINPTILLLYWIHLIFQILVRFRQQLKLLAPMARNWKATSAFCVADSLFSDIIWICKIWLAAQNISSHLSCITQKKIKAFHSNPLPTPFTSQLAFF